MRKLASCVALSFVLSGPLSGPANAQEGAAPGEAARRPLKTLETWLRNFRDGRIDLTSVEDLRSGSVLTARELAEVKGRLTAQRELELVLDGAVAANSDAAAALVLAAAAHALERQRAPKDRAQGIVLQKLADAALARFTDRAALGVVLRAARGDDRKPDAPAQAAALRALGSYGQATFRLTLERGLASKDRDVRIGAGDGLARLLAKDSVPALTAALGAETDAEAARAMVLALAMTLARHRAALEPALATEAERVVLARLGQSSARLDHAVLDFVEQHRSVAAVPAVIALLERFDKNPMDVKSGRLPHWLRVRAQQLLERLTGAHFDKPAQWRAFWEREQERFALAPVVDRDPRAYTVASSFFGIPATGSRIVFVMDVSGSMGFPADTRSEGSVTKEDATTRMDVAKRELLGCVDQLAENCEFTLITFNSAAQIWSRELVPATRGNKDRFRQYVQDLRPDGGTDIWAALGPALAFKSQPKGERYPVYVDEIFLLSDGLPSGGEVSRAEDILRLASEANRVAGARLNTVFIGARMTGRDREAAATAGMTGTELMKGLAQANDGRFVSR